jgi:hypothetical protein
MNTFSDLAKNIGINETLLKGYSCSAHKLYRRYYLQKRKKGEKRKITTPNKILKIYKNGFLKKYFLPCLSTPLPPVLPKDSL